MNVIGYIRVSSGDQVETGLGLGDQERKIRTYCDLYDLNLIEIISDEGKSGRSLNGRDGLQHITERKDIGGVVVAKLDRLTRSVRDLHYLLEACFSRLELHSVGEKIDSSTASGRLMLNVLMSVSAWESEVSGERTSAALQQKKRTVSAKKGRKTSINGRAPFGYTWIEGELQPVPKEQQILDIMNKLRASGLTYQRVADELAERGYQTRRGANWHAPTVRKIIKNDSEITRDSIQLPAKP